MAQIIKKILKFFLKENKKPCKTIKYPFEICRNQAILLFAASKIGVKEIKGSGSNPEIEMYLDHGYSSSNVSTILKDDVPWCSAFICYILERNPFKMMSSTNILMARSYEHWGRKVFDFADVLPGDIATLWRGKHISLGKGHVTIFLGWVQNRKNKFYGIGGNQNDQVNISIYSVEKLTSFRRSSLEFDLSEEEKMDLKDTSRKILSINSVYEGGRVV